MDDLALIAADLAPGDRAVAQRDPRDLRVRRVASAADPDFEAAYARLWSEFGARGEMERRAVIEARLAWDPARPLPGAALAYELLVLRRGGEVVALRDHTAVVLLDEGARPRGGPVVVHLSHAFVEPAHRGTGLAEWLRALPLQAARRCATASGRGADAPIVLVAEMEPRDPAEPARMARLRSYERAGFRLGLVVRRVGREGEDVMPAKEVRAVVESIYAVYGVHVPAAALAPLRAAAAVWTSRPAGFRLLPPTA